MEFIISIKQENDEKKSTYVQNGHPEPVLASWFKNRLVDNHLNAQANSRNNKYEEKQRRLWVKWLPIFLSDCLHDNFPFILYAVTIMLLGIVAGTSPWDGMMGACSKQWAHSVISRKLWFYKIAALLLSSKSKECYKFLKLHEW